MIVDELKQEYNRVLLLIRQGSEYLDNPDVPMKEKEKYAPAFQKLIERASAITREIEQSGIKCMDEELRDGFKIGGG
mgnify:CR=1 FL=1